VQRVPRARAQSSQRRPDQRRWRTGARGLHRIRRGPGAHRAVRQVGFRSKPVRARRGKAGPLVDSFPRSVLASTMRSMRFCAALAALALCRRAAAQMPMNMPMPAGGGLGLPELRTGAGRARPPADLPNHPLHDRQDPHDRFVELAALYDRPVARDLALSLYVAPVGEPALGPVAFPHRPSAAGDPLAPLGHHWQDATHITYGVITAGLFTRSAKLEASWFNGREPDEDRTGFDYAGRRLDSYAARLTVNPSRYWSLATWYGYLASPEALDPTEA